MTMVDENYAIKQAHEALQYPDSYINWADDGAYDTHAPIIGRNRDSGVLENSNWDVVSGDMLKRFPNQCFIKGSKHWAVGWIDQLMVQCFTKKGTVTKAWLAAIEWSDRLSEYPVADEDHFSKAEYEETANNIKQNIPAMCITAENPPNEYEILHCLWNKLDINAGGDDGTWYDTDEIKRACWHLGYVDASEPWLEDWQEWLDDNPEEKEAFEELLRHLARAELERTQMKFQM